jgi:predicted NBD/HSP70 family sugar kinase
MLPRDAVATSSPSGAERETPRANGRYSGQNSASVRRHNRAVVLQAILRYGPISRTHLVQLTGRQPATISSIVGELLAEQVLAEVGRRDSAGSGRRRIDLDFAPGGVCAVGVHLGIEEIGVGIVSPRGEICHTETFWRPLDLDSAATLALIGDSIRQLLARTRTPPRRVVGVGVGIAGLVDPVAGKVVQSARLGWRDVPVVQTLEHALDLPVHVGNNVQAMALAESWFGSYNDADDLVLMNVGTVIGLGMVIGGRIWGGAGWGAGQIGHRRSSQGGAGDVATMATQRAIREAFQRLVDEPALPGVGGAKVVDPVEALVDRALAGDDRCIQLLTRAGDALGLIVADVVNLLNPPLMLITGRVVRAGELLLAPVRERAMTAALPGMVEQTKIEPASLGLQGRIIGPAALALVERFYTSGQLHSVYH